MLFLILLSHLQHINKLWHGPLDCILHDNSIFPKEADAITLFLNPMLGLHPDKCAKASDLIHHNCLDGVLVQGKTNVTRRVEQDEMRGGGGRCYIYWRGHVTQLKAILDQSWTR